MCRLGACLDLNIVDAAVAECDIQFDRSVIAGCCTGIGACGKGYCCITRRRGPFFRRINCLLDSFLDCIRCMGRTGYAVDFSAARIEHLLLQFIESRAADGRCLLVTGQNNIRNLAVFESDICRYDAAEALCLSMVSTRLTGSRAGRRSASAEDSRCRNESTDRSCRKLLSLHFFLHH